MSAPPASRPMAPSPSVVAPVVTSWCLLVSLLSMGCLTRLEVAVCRSNADCEETGFCILRTQSSTGFCAPRSRVDAGPPVEDAGPPAPTGAGETETATSRINDSPTTPEGLANTTGTVLGQLNVDDGFGGDVDCYSVALNLGELLSVRASPTGVAAADLRVTVYPPAQATLPVRARVASDPVSPVATRQVVAPVAGRYALCVEDQRNVLGVRPALGGADFTYALETRVLTPLTVPLTEGDGRVELPFRADGQLAAFRIDVARTMVFVAETVAARATPRRTADTALLLIRGQSRLDRQVVAFSEDIDRESGNVDARISTVLRAGTYTLYVDALEMGTEGSAELRYLLQRPGTEIELNETLAAATPTTLDDGVKGFIAASRNAVADVDVFRIAARAGEYLSTDVIGDDFGLLLPRLQLFDARGRVLDVQHNLMRAASTRLEWLVPSDGDYFLRIEETLNATMEGLVGGFNYGYTLRFTRLARAPIALGVMGAADMTRPSDTLAGPGAKTWYRFEVQGEPRLATFSVSPLGAPFEPRFFFYGATGADALGSESKPSVRKLVEPGRYWMGIADTQGRGPATYRLVGESRAVSSEREPNDAFANATPLPVPGVVRGIVKQPDVDVFAMELEPATRLSLETLSGERDGRGVDTVLELFDSRGRLLVRDDEGGTPPHSRILAFVVPARGRYYARVSTKPERSGAYVLVADTGPCAPVEGARRPEDEPFALRFNELLTRAPEGPLGDVNGDGVSEPGGDAFIELLNTSAATLDLSGVKLQDEDSPCDPSGAHTLFTFACGTRLRAGEAAIVFGGGEPRGDFGTASVFVSDFPTRCQLHSGHAETLRLRGASGAELARFTTSQSSCDTLGCVCEAQSCGREPDGTGAFAQGLVGDVASPGRRNVDDAAFGDEPPQNDRCAGALPLVAGVEVSGDGRFARNDFRASCGQDLGDVVYTFTLDATRDVLLSAPGARSLTLLSSCNDATPMRASLDEVACSPTETLSVTELLGDTRTPRRYFVAVDAPGPFSLRLATAPPVVRVPGDRCAVAQALEPNAALIGESTVGALADYDPPLSCGPLPSPLRGGDVAYRVRLSAGQTVEATVRPRWPFDPAVFVTRDCGELTRSCLAGSDSGRSGEVERVRFTATVDDDYFIVVGSYAPFEAGLFNLSLSLRSQGNP